MAAKQWPKLPESASEIAAFIQSLAIDDDVLQMLLTLLTRQTVTLQGYVDFTLGNLSPKN